MEYRMSGALKVMYTVTGLVFAGVALWLWLWPAGGPLRTACPAAAAAVFVLGVLFLLRPWRARLRLEDGGTLFYCDGYLPGRRRPLCELFRVTVRDSRRLSLAFRDGRTLAVEFLFDGLESFLAELRARGIEVRR